MGLFQALATSLSDLGISTSWGSATCTFRQSPLFSPVAPRPAAVAVASETYETK